MLLQTNKISKAFLEDSILKEASFNIEDYEKVAVVGVNGAGKSTLLKILIGEIKADSGSFSIAKNKTIGYLPQHQNIDSHRSIYEEVKTAKRELIALEERIRDLEGILSVQKGEELEKTMALYHSLMAEFEYQNGYAVESEIAGVIKGLGFLEEDFSKSVNTLSGGEKTRVALGKLLLTKPDLLLLDEPTNHLDLSSVSWLETYLLNYKGGVIIVSHDRYFLNKVVTKVLEIDMGVLNVYKGNYEDYAKKRKEIRHGKMKAYLKQQDEINHQKKVIEKLKSFNREKSIKRAESREKMLDKIERIEKPQEVNSRMGLEFSPGSRSGNDVLKCEGLSKSFGHQLLFSNLSFEIKRREKVAIIGNNGTGKTTLLKIINGMVSQDAGTLSIGASVDIAYYDQEHHILNEKNTVFEEISDAYPDLSNTAIRNLLAGFLFFGDDVQKLISSLSGGEKGRVSLAKLMLSKANLLILDEPTNHLDVDSKEILEEALQSFEGTVLYVSHDRYFINQTATRILELKNHGFENYIGNYDYYLEKHLERESLIELENTESADDNKGKLSWQEQKEEKARELKRENDRKKIENEILEAEARVEEIDGLLCQEEIYTNSVKCQELATEKEALEKTLEDAYKKWDQLM
ncbi:ATP-binding cassette subfamily F protein 3 [Aequitasia blattaphilus]|uniref:ABC-F type ribosomal protection protein n=1 Tax=Aequitasia blattaphilus TaxID=2949332 RepID=A0ABT1EAX9_9FIRM|nr:ABC-F type ribosomal protection protein [Aequitasia blattaphilus]MCP1101662.1 ABC-F type ribosomal protection protein [Aequitasia blattaphilus]MCR8614302.1 ABC-F type ribosomal protection protein [Aequitasia blattaphilus]